MLTGYRVCPSCHQDLPYYVGRSRQQLVALTGCRATGKTIYLWSLLYQLRDVLARARHPYAVAMFEDDISYRLYQKLSHSLLVVREVPETTQVEDLKVHGKLLPLIVAHPRGQVGRASFCNLVLYDPSGELIENLDEVRYLRYLASAAAIIYLVDCPADDTSSEAEARASTASEGLDGIIRQIRHERQLGQSRQIPQSLAVVLTKCDAQLFPKQGAARLVPGHGQELGFWSKWTAKEQTEVDRTSSRCEQKLRAHGYDNLVVKARLNFARVRYFAVSSLGSAPVEGQLIEPPAPVGVENPLFWVMRTLR